MIPFDERHPRLSAPGVRVAALQLPHRIEASAFFLPKLRRNI